MQSRIDKMTKVFTNLVEELTTAIATLQNGIKNNDYVIELMKEKSDLYANKVVEYEKMKNRIETLIK